MLYFIIWMASHTGHRNYNDVDLLVNVNLIKINVKKLTHLRLTYKQILCAYTTLDHDHKISV